jgi:hypothetical protein
MDGDDMNASCAATRSESRPSASVIAERLRNAKGLAISSALGKSDSWARKVLDGESGVLLDDLPGLLKELGLRVVGVDRVCVPRDEYQAYRALAAQYLKQPQRLEEDWE